MKINYKEKKLLSEQEVNEKEVEFAVEDAKLQLQSDILATKRLLEKKKIELADAKTCYPLDVEFIIELSNQVEDCEAGILELEKLQEELGLK